MKKILSIVAFALAAIFVCSSFWLKTGAKRASLNQDDIERIKQISLEHLQNHTATRGLIGGGELKFEKTELDELGMSHTRFRQTLNNVPVWGGEAIVHLQPDESLSTISDDMKDIIPVSTDPNFSEKDAVEIALKLYGKSAKVRTGIDVSKVLTEEPKADLWIFPAEDGTTHLAYRVQLRREDGTKDTAMPVYFIDAHSGEQIFYYDNLQTGTGSSLYSGTVTIGTSSSAGTYYLENLTRKVGTFDNRNTTSSTYRFTDTDDVWNSTTQRAAVDAQYGAEATMNYYQNVHSRNGIDGSGGPAYYTSATGSVGLISSKVHYSTNYNNAFWNGSYMTYGDGDGSTFTPLTTLDICGHEMTHGVTERTAGLTYSNESGALNESMSDVMGTMVERYVRPSTWNWKIGEDAYTPGTAGDALRLMDNPHAVGDPDHYSLRYTGTSDNGGVHTNSSITNHTFYLIANGGTNRVSGVAVTGIGPDNAAKIWYRALTVYMTSSTNFAGARTATTNAANDLFGSTSSQANSVATGWCAVGVGSCPGGGGTPTPTPTPTPGGSELIVNGGFEGSASPWVNSGSGTFYTNAGSYPHGGTGYDYFGVNNNVTGQAYQQVAIPTSASGNLTFWLNVSSSESASTPYDYLYVEVRNTSGALLQTLATYSNQNKTTAGSYSQKSFSLAAYKGQTVQIQFRTTTDSSVTTTFRVDDVSLK
ncbi:MAG: M4 family metallopeptidase [Pyrinomonadaceae bacterium]